VRTLVIGLIAVVGTALLPSSATTQDAAPVHEIRFAADIDRFLENDKAVPPPRHGILFVGSSIFRLWTTVTEQMAPLPVFNRGFGGSRTWEILAYMDKIVLPYEPDIIVYYCGSNDVNAGEPAEAIVARFEQFVRRVAERLPDTRVFFVSIHRSPDKRARWSVVDEANARIKALAYATPNLDYIEVNPVLFDARDEPRTELYLADGLHFHPPAYVEFTNIIKPVLERAWSERH
jgi:lysophospholipase L1-like esterase